MPSHLPDRPLRALSRRHLMLAMWAALAGVILTLTVAWTAQLIDGPMLDRSGVSIAYRPEADGTSQRSVHFQRMRNRWQTWANVSRTTAYPFDEPIVSASALTPSQRTAAEQTRAILPLDDLRRTPIVSELGIGWATFPPSEDDDPPEIRAVATMAYGWPCRALCHGNDATLRSEALIVRRFGLLETSFGQFACKPLYRGLVINTTLYGAIIWATLAAPSLARRLHRRRHGRCIHCGYDRAGLGTAVCPECGH